MTITSLLTGAAVAVAARAAVPALIRAKLNGDVVRLGRGDYGPLLAGYAEDATLHFHEGDHRWEGTYRGKAAIEVFLKNFVAAGLTGEIGRVWVSGPPWAMEMCVRFDDAAHAPTGEQIYANRTVLWVRTRWGRIVEQRDFYEDTQRILDLDARLTEMGVPAIA
ncbi:nuclear transport factor 2 family protein [Nocardioides ferulae]|uniref:nuclear transport factor 2 family protein n=1 Tax=Nocardioides ferulae TaxID=2340821 RepID=UPI000EB0AF3A|nr:nuclear transport factor 2 family protein [Nocardioides ferulae]